MTNTDDRESRIKKAENLVLRELKNGDAFVQSLTVVIMGGLRVSEGSARGYLKDMEGRKIIKRKGDLISLSK